jgi:hypothetical protein
LQIIFRNLSLFSKHLLSNKRSYVQGAFSILIKYYGKRAVCISCWVWMFKSFTFSVYRCRN